MKNMTMKNVSEIAKGLNITLSYKAESGTRKRYTKSELIEMIIKIQTPIVEEMKLTTELKSEIETISNTVEVAPVVELQINTVVSESRKLISHGQIEKVKMFIDELTSRIKNERRNKLLIANMSSKVNILKSLIKQYLKSNKSALTQ